MAAINNNSVLANNNSDVAQKLNVLVQFVNSLQAASTRTEDPEVLPIGTKTTFRAHYDGAVVSFLRNGLGVFAPKGVEQPEDCVISNTITVYDKAGVKRVIDTKALTGATKKSRFTKSQRLVQWYLLGPEPDLHVQNDPNCRCCRCRDNRATVVMSQSLRRRDPQYCTWVRQETCFYGLFKYKPVMMVIPSATAMEICGLMFDAYCLKGWDESTFLLQWERLSGVVNNSYTLDIAEKTYTRLLVRDLCQAKFQRLSAVVNMSKN